MYVCICNQVTDSDIRRAVLEGASQLKRLQRRLQFGADCGSCLEEAQQCLRRALNEQRVRSLGPVGLRDRGEASGFAITQGE